MVASPATEPVSNPRNLGLRLVSHSTKNHAMPAKDAAMSVLRNAVAVVASTRNSLPALNPYQPNHSNPVPSATSGMLCGPGGSGILVAHKELFRTRVPERPGGGTVDYVAAFDRLDLFLHVYVAINAAHAARSMLAIVRKLGRRAS